MSTTETLLDLKVHKLSNESYEAKKSEGSLDSAALYLTPELPPTDTDVKLSADLYTYAPVGLVQKASAGVIGSGDAISSSNPGKIGSAAESLKDVFNRVFGEETPIQPSINTNDVKLTIVHSPDTKTYTGASSSTEFGAAVAAVSSVTYTITLSNNATAQYGYRCGDEEPNTTASAAIYYPAKKVYDSNKAQLKITLPSSKAVTVTEGTLVSTDSTNNILYCNFKDSKTIQFTVSLDSATVTTSQQTRYGAVSAEVTLGNAQTEDTSDALPVLPTETSKIITKFLAYKPVTKSYEDSTVVVDGTNIGTDSNMGKLTDSEDAINISAGYVPYAWVLATAAVAAGGNLPTTNKRQSAYTSIPITDGDGTKYLYIYVPSNKSITDIKNNNQTAHFTTDSTSRLLKVNGRSTAFKVYHVNAKVAAGSNNFTITYITNS